MELAADIGARVRAARSYAGLSQKELGDAIGLERRVIGAIEDGDSRHELTVPEARRIADRCGVPLSFLTGGWPVAPENLADRVAALEDQVSGLRDDQDSLDRLVHETSNGYENRFEELNTRLEKSLADAVRRAVAQDRKQRPGDGRRKGGGPPAQ